MSAMRDRSAYSLRRVFAAAVLLAAGAIVAQATAMLAAQINAGVAAYLVGESYWSKARARVEGGLRRYADNGDRQNLDEARAGLQVLFADRDARLALEASPPDLDAARVGFLGGMNSAENTEYLIWMFRYFRHAPYFGDAVERWIAADEGVLQLDELLRRFESTSFDDAVAIAALRREVVVTGERLRTLQLEFLQALADGVDRLGALMNLLGAGGFVLLAFCMFLLLRAVQRRVVDSENSFHSVFERADIGIARLDAEGRFLRVNPRLCRLLDRDEDALCGNPLNDYVDELHGAASIDFGRRVPAERTALLESCSLRRRDGSLVHCRLKLFALAARGDEASEWIVLLEDVSETHRLTRELAYVASHDAVTGLINRHEMRSLIAQTLARCRRDHSFHTLVVLDLDQFGLINDAYGQAAGDDVLRRTAATLVQRLGSRHVLARMGADEFAVLLEDVPLTEAQAIAESLLRAVRESSYRFDARRFELSACAGIVELGAAAPDTSWAFRAAQTACNLAKEQGRNRIRVYVESDQVVARRRADVEWVQEIRLAIAEQRIYLFAQRIWSLDEPQQLQFEVLVRLIDRNGRLHAPGVFIPAAEKYELVSAVDREVVRQLLAALDQRRDQLDSITQCHVNVSAQSVSSPEFRAGLVADIREHAIPPGLLCFELTETTAISNLAEACTFIDEMHRLGCRIALDDFGSGMSSFGYLKSLAVDVLKIDGMFVRRAAEDTYDQSVLGAIAHVGRALGKVTVAECVESEAVLPVLRLLGVDAAQGYALEKPRPLEELLEAALADVAQTAGV